MNLKEDGFLGELVSTFNRKYLVSELEKFQVGKTTSDEYVIACSLKQVSSDCPSIIVQISHKTKQVKVLDYIPLNQFLAQVGESGCQ